MADGVSNRSLLGRRTLLEMSLGYSHQCNGCGKVFLQHEDGCPDCGSNASVSLLQKGPVTYNNDLNSDDGDWYVIFIDDISNKMLILSADIPQEIRLQDDIEEFVYWIVIVNDEPSYVFLGDCSYL